MHLDHWGSRERILVDRRFVGAVASKRNDDLVTIVTLPWNSDTPCPVFTFERKQGWRLRSFKYRAYEISANWRLLL